MVVTMETKDLLAEVGKFLAVTLAEERLSPGAEGRRQELLRRLPLCAREASPATGYIDMNGSFQPPKFESQISDCYEEFDNIGHPEKCKQHIPQTFMNKLYSNHSVKETNIYANNEDETDNYVNIKHASPYEDNMYINPSSPLANTPVIPKSPPVKPSSAPSSERNSVISLKKDSGGSDCSSFTSSSTRCDEFPEVLAMSASALRYAAAKTGALGRRERLVHIIEYTKFYWAAVLNQTLFMFKSDKEAKPACELDLSGYHARSVDISGNKADFKFELVSPGKPTLEFVTEKQIDMDQWIAAINAANREGETPSPRGSRQLPTPPPYYDQPDGARRPMHSRHASLDHSRSYSNQIVPSERYANISRRRRSTHSPQEARQLPPPPPPLETYDQLEPSVRPVHGHYEEQMYHCIDSDGDSQKESVRRLPQLPVEQETYDQPDPTLKPVVQEELYSVIDNNHDFDHQFKHEHVAVYKHVENNDKKEQEEEGNYYNVLPSYPETNTDQECIYDVITEQRQLPRQASDNHQPTETADPAPPKIKLNSETPSNMLKPKQESNVRPKKQVTHENTEIKMMQNNENRKLQTIQIVQSDKSNPKIILKNDEKLPKPSLVSSLTEEIKQKFEDKKISSNVLNKAKMFNKPLLRTQLKEVKPPTIKNYQ